MKESEAKSVLPFNLCSDSYKSFLVVMTPAMAAYILEKCGEIKNRILKPWKVAEWKQALIDGDWGVCGQGLIFSKEGQLMDGQHRLWAILETEIAAELPVTLGIAKENMKHIDVGIKRSPGDVLNFSGVKNATTAAAMISWLGAYEYAKTAGNWPNKSTVSIPPGKILERYEESRDEMEEAARVGHEAGSKLLTPAACAGIYRVAIELGQRELGARLLTYIKTGDSEVPQAFLRLREFLIKDRMKLRRTPPAVIYALVIKCWNAARANKPINIMRFDPESERFPIMK